MQEHCHNNEDARMRDVVDGTNGFLVAPKTQSIERMYQKIIMMKARDVRKRKNDQEPLSSKSFQTKLSSKVIKKSMKTSAS